MHRVRVAGEVTHERVGRATCHAQLSVDPAAGFTHGLLTLPAATNNGAGIKAGGDLLLDCGPNFGAAVPVKPKVPPPTATNRLHAITSPTDRLHGVTSAACDVKLPANPLVLELLQWQREGCKLFRAPFSHPPACREDAPAASNSPQIASKPLGP